MFSLLSLTHNVQYPDVLERVRENKMTGEYEASYLQMVAKYPENTTKEKGERPVDYFASAWGALQKETFESQEDILGEIYMSKISLGEHGQYFTPLSVTDMMTQLIGKEGKTVSDPACGSGRFFISIAKGNKNAHFYGVDLSPICAKMAVLNMWLFDLNADIFHGDSLTMQMRTVWKVRKGGFLYEEEVTGQANTISEPVKKQLIKQAEQQRLFE